MFVLNKSHKFPLKTNEEGVRYIFIFGGSGKARMESYTNSKLHLECIQKLLESRFNSNLDQMLGVKHAPKEALIYILDPTVIKGRLKRLLKEKKEDKD